jgi:PAS domain S-box-containing protein
LNGTTSRLIQGAAALVLGVAGGWAVIASRRRQRIESDPHSGEIPSNPPSAIVEAERYAALAESIPQLLWVARVDGGLVDANRRWADYTGRPWEESLGLRWQDVVHKDDLPTALTAWQVAAAAGAAYESEFRLRRHDGAYRWHISRAVPVRDPDTGATRWYGTSTDVDDQKRLEAERAALVTRLRLYLDRIPVACIVTGPDHRLTDWNPAAERIFGYTRAEALGHTAHDLGLIPDTAQSHVRDILRRLVSGDMAAHSVNENRTKDGRIIRCEWYNTPLAGPGGRFAGVLCVGLDVTEKWRLEEEVRHANKMEAVGRLAGGIAHDFNNILTAVSGFSDLALDALASHHPAWGMVDEVRKAGQRAAGLTRQLLAFSRRQVLQPRILDLNALVIDLDRLLRRVIGEDVQLVTELQPRVWPVKADPGQVEQVVMNLAVNARDAMPTGGRLTVRTRNADGCVVLEATDTGCGMTPEVKAQVFEPFFTTKGPGQGTGLGLATVHAIAEQSGGRIEVESEPGQGATFRFYLPRAAEAATVPPARSRNAAVLPHGTETVLLAEDEPAVRSLAARVLRGCGYVVLEAEDGAEAKQLVDRYGEPVHLLVTDVVMPGTGGRELAERLTARHPNLRVIYSSGYTDDQVVRHGVEQDRVHFLPKPYTPVALAAKVREVLDGGSAGPSGSTDLPNDVTISNRSSETLRDIESQLIEPVRLGSESNPAR